MAESQIGVLIDYENVGLGSMQSLFDQLSDMGRMIIKRAYADWSKTPAKGSELLELGIEAKQYFHPPGSGKNAADIYLAIDAIELLHRSPVDTFVIVSSDTDFVPLVSALRSAGKTVIGAGRRGVVSPGLVRSCDRYIYLDDGKPTLQAHTALKAQAEELLVRATMASTDDQGQVVAATLHNTMRRMDPSFDYRAIGHKSFTQFLASSSRVTVHRPRGQGDVSIELVGGHIQRDIQTTEPESTNPRYPDIDEAWSKIPGDSIAGSKAASEAAKVLGISKLSASRYKNLQGLLDASEVLRDRWFHERNTIRRRSGASSPSQ